MNTLSQPTRTAFTGSLLAAIRVNVPTRHDRWLGCFGYNQTLSPTWSLQNIAGLLGKLNTCHSCLFYIHALVALFYFYLRWFLHSDKFFGSPRAFLSFFDPFFSLFWLIY